MTSRYVATYATRSYGAAPAGSRITLLALGDCPRASDGGITFIALYSYTSTAHASCSSFFAMDYGAASSADHLSLNGTD